MGYHNVKKILVIKLRHIGDVLLTVPVFRAVRETFPDAHAAALINSGTEDVLKGNPLIDELLILDRDTKKLSPIKRYAKEVDFLKKVREKGFDMTVDLTGGDRAAIISFISGARYRFGWRSNKGFIGKNHLYTHLSEPDGRKHMVLQNLDILRQHKIDTGNLSVDFHIPEDSRLFIRKLLEEKGIKKDDLIVHIHPTSRWLFKCWNDKYMAGIINWLLDKDAVVIVTSSPDSREIEKAKGILSLIEPSPKLIDLSGRTTLKQLGAISDASGLFLGVDSAPMHIAAAVGTPVVALFGPSGAFNWGPWDNTSSQSEPPYQKRNGIQTFGMHTVIQRDWDCIPCGKDGCSGSKTSNCLEDIAPEEIKDILNF